MYRSFYVVWIGPSGWLQREDFDGYHTFADALRRYRPYRHSQLWGVDWMDRSCLLGERV
jgi:hypothetical protein